MSVTTGTETRRGVVVTAMAATTCLGADLDATWSRLLVGDSGIGTLTDDVVTDNDLPVRIGGRLVAQPGEQVT
ncbi:beta-ketoacyl synthase N-terminal-like domain-containing protein, partial [Nocardia sp. NPDC059246]|uniref:beta-ketoacyl synthase N-terminal-like domain-containing protein n=1 Tax=Nocardia sp. NPDC059246 TaxID=3346789 RepID=UPI00368DA227